MELGERGANVRLRNVGPLDEYHQSLDNIFQLAGLHAEETLLKNRPNMIHRYLEAVSVWTR